VRAARSALAAAKQEYSSSVLLRSQTQRELTELLNRKLSWTPEDLARFTRLYPSDHENEGRVQRAQEKLSQAERESEEVSSELGRLILTR
jgi:sensitive to high expression protein 9